MRSNPKKSINEFWTFGVNFRFDAKEQLWFFDMWGRRMRTHGFLFREDAESWWRVSNFNTIEANSFSSKPIVSTGWISVGGTKIMRLR